jgi:hypothetical protein
MDTEALVIVEEARAAEVLSRVGERVEVTQRLPPRLAIARGAREALEAVRHLPGVVSVSEGPVPVPVLNGLNPTEQVFAEAWVLGRKPKAFRPGEGLSWDAPGFQPPDRPDKDACD